MSAHRKPEQIKAQQAAAIPFRRRNNSVQFCLVTSTSGKWIFPKGAIKEGQGLAEVASIEALEEAGLVGHVFEPPVGCYELIKKNSQKTVVALLMQVARTQRTWQESDRRQRAWVSHREATTRLESGPLLPLLDIAWNLIAILPTRARSKGPLPHVALDLLTQEHSRTFIT